MRGLTAFRPLRHRNFALVWTSALVSNVGTWMETVAVGDLVAVRTGQAGWTGLVAAAAFLPMGLMGPIGGAIADRVDRRRFMLITTWLQMLAAGALTLLSATGNASPAAVAAVVFVAGCVAGIGFPAYQAILPELVPADELLGAVSLGQAQFNLGRVVGPALAGVAIALGSYTYAFAINTVSFGALVVALLLLQVPHRPNHDTSSLWRRIVVAGKAVAAEPGVRGATIFIGIIALTASPFIALIPAMARVRFDDDGGFLTSVFVTAQGIGAVAGALAVPSLAARFGRHRMLLIGLVWLPVALMLYGASPTAWLAAVALLNVGAAYICVFSGLGTVVQLRAPVALRARIISLYFMALGTLYPIGAAIQGPIADRLSLGSVTIGGAVLLLVIVVATAVLRPEVLRSLDDTDAFPSPLAADAGAGAPA
jgi:MFS family permease